MAYGFQLDIAAHQHYHFMKQSASIYLASKKKRGLAFGVASQAEDLTKENKKITNWN